MPPGNICAVVGCNTKKKEENVTSFTLPNNTNIEVNGKQAIKDSSKTLPNTDTSKEPIGTTSVTLSNTQSPTNTETSLTENPPLESLTSAVPSNQESSSNLAHAITETSLEISDCELSEGSFNKMPLQLTKPAPQFKTTAVVNGEFKDISLADYKGKYVVLFFYPLDFTFVCPTEIIAFSERADDFRKIGCELIAASTDSHFSHLAWINTPRKQGGLGPMNIPILSDKSHRIARDYGVLDEESGVPFRGLFIIDDAQRLRQITVNDLPVGRSVEETLRLVQAFQYTDKYGEVCPANWHPGSKTIKPDTKAAKEYFGDAN